MMMRTTTTTTINLDNDDDVVGGGATTATTTSAAASSTTTTTPPATTTTTTLKLYSAWFCPYAQRVWCALRALGVPNFDLIEALQIDPVTGEYIKNAQLLRHNPQGLVPTLVTTQKKEQEDNHDEKVVVVCDSMEILKQLYSNYNHEAAAAAQLVQGGGGRSKDDDDTTTLVVDQWYKDAQYFNQCLCSPFYTALMKPTAAERQAGWEQMCTGMREFAQHLSWLNDDNDNDDGSSSGISFYQSTKTTAAATTAGTENDKCPTLVDLCVFPFVHRLYVLEHYKGFTLPASKEEEEPSSTIEGSDGNDIAQENNDNDNNKASCNDADDWVAKIKQWLLKMEALSPIQATLAKRNDLLPIYKAYSDGSAKSKVGNFVRQGKQAHEV